MLHHRDEGKTLPVRTVCAGEPNTPGFSAPWASTGSGQVIGDGKGVMMMGGYHSRYSKIVTSA